VNLVEYDAICRQCKEQGYREAVHDAEARAAAAWSESVKRGEAIHEALRILSYVQQSTQQPATWNVIQQAVDVLNKGVTP